MKARIDECLILGEKKKSEILELMNAKLRSPEMPYCMPPIGDCRFLPNVSTARQYGVTYQRGINLVTKFLMKKFSYTLNCKYIVILHFLEYHKKCSPIGRFCCDDHRSLFLLRRNSKIHFLLNDVYCFPEDNFKPM
jgi:hypothetical protein